MIDKYWVHENFEEAAKFIDSLTAECEELKAYKETAQERFNLLLQERDELKEVVEQLRVQLAGCGVAAMCNTEKSREEQKCSIGDYGYSASYQDVLDAVAREIKYRAALERIADESNKNCADVAHINCIAQEALK